MEGYFLCSRFWLTRKMWVYVMVSVRPAVCGKNLNVAIFSDTSKWKMSNFACWQYLLSFTYSYHFQWPWQYFKATKASNSFNWKLYVLIRLSWNFVRLFITSSRSCIYHFFWFSHLFKGDNRCFLVWQKTLLLALSLTPCKRGFSNFVLLSPCLATSLCQVWWPWCRFMVKVV